MDMSSELNDLKINAKMLMGNHIGCQYQYMFCYNKSIKNLKHELVNLKYFKDNMLEIIEVHKRNEEVNGENVLRWLEIMDEVEKECEEVLGYGVSSSVAAVRCLKWKCPNLKIRYIKSKKARNMALLVKLIMQRGIIAQHPSLILSYGPVRLGKLVELVEASNTSKKLFLSRSSLGVEIMDALKSDEVSVIGICGIRGVGKTTLAEEVSVRARSEHVIHDFVVIFVSENTNLIKIQDNLLEILGVGIITEDFHARAQCLHERLLAAGADGTRTSLIIFDDVREAIDLVNLGIPVGFANCKVILTSRSESICNEMGSQKNFVVDVLFDQEAWDLFKDTVGEYMDEDDEDDLHDIALGCGGVPLEIITIGKALRDVSEHERADALAGLTASTSSSKVPPRRKGNNKLSWDDALQQLRKSAVTTNIYQLKQREAYSKIKSIYYDLIGRKAKALFVLCCQFPEDEFISIEMLVRCQHGIQGFEEFASLESARNQVYSLVDELKGHGLLQQVGNDSLVKVEVLERHFGKSISSKDGKEMYVVLRGHGSSGSMKEYHRQHDDDKYELYTTISLNSNEMHELPTSLDFAKVNLLWLSYSHHEEIEISAELFEGMEKLKVVHLRANFVKPLPLSLKFLTNLQTLCLDFCSLLVDISFIGDLKNLEILSFFHSTLNILPRQIGGLSKLKLLDLRCSVGPCMIPSGVFSNLKELQELYTGSYFDVANVQTHNKRNSANVEELNLLSEVKILQISLDLDNGILRKLNKFHFENLVGFDFSMFERKSLPLFPPLQLSKVAALSGVDMSLVLTTNVKELMRRAEKLSLSGMVKLENCVIELDKEVFANLKRLIISDCSGVERVLDSVRNSAVANLESLEIVEMSDLKEISSRYLPIGSFVRLEELSLIGLPSMVSLWRGHIELPSLGNLRILKMLDCCSIKSLFRRPVAQCLVKLEQLEITQCKELMEAISRGADEDHETAELPNLKEMMLSELPRFSSFYPKSTDYPGTTLSLLNQQVMLPNMEIMDVCNLSNHLRIVADGNQSKFLHKLRVLRVSQCKSLEAVFDLKRYDHSAEVMLLDQLESMELRDLPQLSRIWRRVPDGCEGFCNLKSLVITRCGSMRYLLSVSMAKMFVNLQELKLEGCEMMKEVIKMEAEEESSDISDIESMDKMLIPQLRTLELQNMKNLAIFWYGTREFELSVLKNVCISNYPEMVTFFYPGRLIAPNLVRVQTHHVNSNQWVWKGDLNSTVTYITERSKDAEFS